jgi:hypothetical protein
MVFFNKSAVCRTLLLHNCTVWYSQYILNDTMRHPILEITPTIVCCHLLLCAFSLNATPVEKLSEQREVIVHQLDSLDLLKQDLKRNGIAITEIELQQNQLHDSLQHLRTRIQSSTENIPFQSGSKNSLKFIQRPTNLFDWIIVIVGIVAFFSGLLLIVGISRSLSTRRRRHTVKKTSPHTPPPPKPDPTPLYKNPGNALPSPPPSEKPLPGQPKPLTETGSIRLLRQRMEESESPAPPAMPKAPEKPSSQEPIPSVLLPEADTLASEVIAAAKSGLDTVAISRKFHISVDHVALLLKIAVPRK